MNEDKIDPLQNNIRAATTIVNTVKSTLGPMGRDKMMVDAGGDTIITNDGATILRELDVGHPGAKMMVDISKTQESLCYDGTTSTVVFSGQLLKESENLFTKGLHPNLVAKGYNQAARMAIEHLETLATDGGMTPHDIAKTAITGKSLETAADVVAELCVEAVETAGDADSVKVMSLSGGSLHDSYFFNGYVVNKDSVLEYDGSLDESVILLNNGLEPSKEKENVQMQFTDLQGYTAFKEGDKDDLLDRAKRIAALLPNGGLIFIRDGCTDEVVNYLHKQNIAVVRRLPESTMKGLSTTLGINIAQNPDDIEDVAYGKVEKVKHDDINYFFVASDTHESNQSTLILRGASPSTLDEVARGFDDALGVVSMVMNGGRMVYGGGSTYVSMANHLRNKSATVEGRGQMAINAFADALEVIPATIAENAGHDPLDCLLSLRHAISEGRIQFGPDVENGGITSMQDLGVVEPLDLVKQAILSATEVTSAILKIDDIIAKRGE
tara:strand:+ start:3267 stop:4757 length:1491 start_codon:yes stop_codon:yes gene_type:complete